MKAVGERKDRETLLAVAERLGLFMPEIYRPGIVESLERLLDQARLVLAVPISRSPDTPGDFRP